MSRIDRSRFTPFRSRLIALATVLLGMVVFSAPAAALATDPVSLNGAYVLDRVGALGDRSAEVQDAIDGLSAAQGINLFVVYVDTFSGAENRDAWADETAVKNGLGVNDVLLAVSTGDRLYQVSVDPNFPLDDTQLSELETAAIQPALRQNDWAGAAINASTGIGELIQGETVSVPEITPGTQPAPGSRSNTLTWVLGGAVVVVGGVVGIVFLRKRSKTKADADRAGPSGPSQADLDREVGRLLVQLDDAVTSSEQELGFAVAQFGDDATASFVQALASAKDKVRQSFAFKQKLDDHTPDSSEDRRAWSLSIIELCSTAEAELDGQADAFAALRELEKNPQPSLDAIAASVSDVQPHLAPAAARVDALSSRYSSRAVSTIADNPNQAQKLLDYATATATAAPGLIASGDPAGAAVSIRRAQAAVGQAGSLLAAIDALGQSLDGAAANLSAAAREASSDTEEARALLLTPAGAARREELNPLVSALETAISRATGAGSTAGGSDPLAELQALQLANAPLDLALAGAREQVARLARTREQLTRTLSTASSTIGAVKEFVVTRRGAVSVDARTRIAEAERLLAEAYGLQETAPEDALTRASQANSYAQAADQAARSDVEAYSGYTNQGSGSGIDGGALLGGLLGGLLSGNGGGGSYSRGGSGWGGGGRSSGSSRSSGSGRSGRSSGSSRSSSSGRSGGRRGGGGRF